MEMWWVLSEVRCKSAARGELQGGVAEGRYADSLMRLRLRRAQKPVAGVRSAGSGGNLDAVWE